MDHVIPQDEYFEWEDIMSFRTSLGEKDENMMPPSELLASCNQKTESVRACELPDVQPTEDDGTGMATSKSLCTIWTSLKLANSVSETKTSPINFPSYAEFDDQASAFLIEKFAVEAEIYEEMRETMDDIAISPDPLRHVDYLSHDWREEDIWATWKRLVAKRRAHNTAERLENASWRAWAKVRLDLKTVEPESFSWMKDLDDTWLYGPFHGKTSSPTTVVAEYSNNLNASQATLTVKKTRSILKRPRLSEVLLRGSEFMKTSRSKSVEVESRPSFGNTVKKRVGFREEVEHYAAVQKVYADHNEPQDELDHWTEMHQSKFDYGKIYDDPVEDLLSTTKSFRHHVEQNIKMLDSYRQQKPAEKLGPGPIKPLKDTAETASSSDDPVKIANSSTRYFNKSLRFSSLSEWTLLGDGFDEEEDWIEPTPCTTWRPNAESDITSHIRNESKQDIIPREKLADVQINIGDQTSEELTALMRCEELDLDPSSSDTSETHSSGSEGVEGDDLAYVSICDFPEERSEVRETRSAPTFHQMKQAFVDRVMEDLYISSKDNSAQDFNTIMPPDLIHPALKAA